MKVLLASSILAVAPLIGMGAEPSERCATWAAQIVSGPAAACSELCPQAMEFDGYDYRKGFTEAMRSPSGLAKFLAYLERSTIMGSGAELHACAVRSLLERWGDAAFSTALSHQPQQVSDEAIGLIDYTALEMFQHRFPLTYAMADHE